jgi:2-methylisocitrate lyase-like PEP mutase family enzyme
MKSQLEKAVALQSLHERPGCFVIANAWDAGSARMLSDEGFEALASSSGASAAAAGTTDGRLGRDEVLTHLRVLAGATDLPLSADLENGMSDTLEGIAETFRLAAAAGIVGGSIEDGPRGADNLYSLDEAVQRVAAAREATRSLPFPFTLTARCEGFLRGRPDLDDTIARLKAYEAAGADVLFAPGLQTLEQVRAVCSALSRPVNYMIGIPGRSFSLQELADAGVKRVSVAGSLYRTAMNAARAAAREIRSQGTFTYVDSAKR